MCNYSTANKQFFFSPKFISQEITCRITVVIFCMFILEFYCQHLFREKFLTLILKLNYSLWSEVQLHIKKIVKCESCWPFDVIYHEGKIIFLQSKSTDGNVYLQLFKWYGTYSFFQKCLEWSNFSHTSSFLFLWMNFVNW